MNGSRISHRALAVGLGAIILAAGGSSLGLAQSDGWAGRYTGAFDGGDGEVTISGPSPNGVNYQVAVEVAGRGTGCSGEARGVGAARGSTLTLEIPNDFSPGICTVTLAKTANGLRVSESGCGELHGASCAFSGTVRRPGAASAPPVSGPAWYGSGAGEAFVRDANGLGLVLEVGCDPGDDEPFVAIGVPNTLSVETSGVLTGGGAFARRFRGFTGATVRALDAQGRVIGTATIHPHRMDGSGTVWLGDTMSEAALTAIKRSASIQVASSQWTATFSGKGATAAIRRSSCQR